MFTGCTCCLVLGQVDKVLDYRQIKTNKSKTVNKNLLPVEQKLESRGPPVLREARASSDRPSHDSFLSSLPVQVCLELGRATC